MRKREGESHLEPFGAFGVRGERRCIRVGGGMIDGLPTVRGEALPDALGGVLAGVFGGLLLGLFRI